MLGAGLVGGDEGQVDVGLHHGGELHLGLFGGLLQPLQRHPVRAQVDTLVLAELVGQVVDDALVEVFAAEEGVAVGRLDFEHAVADFQDRNVEGAAAEIEDRDLLVLFLVQSVGERGRGGLVDDAEHVEPGDTAGVLGGLALAVVEVGRHRDDRLGHFFAEIVLGRLLHLLQDERGNFGRAVFLAADFHPGRAVVVAHDLVGQHFERLLHFGVFEPPAHQALDREHRIGRIGDRLSARDLSHQPLARIRKGDDRRGGPGTLRVGDNDGVAPFHHRDATVGRAQVDSDYFCHGFKKPLTFPNNHYFNIFNDLKFSQPFRRRRLRRSFRRAVSRRRLGHRHTRRTQDALARPGSRDGTR